MRNWVVILSAIVMGGFSFGKDWPLSERGLDDILQRSSHWSELTQEKQSEIRSKLIYALHLAGSLEARKVFFGHVDEFWDNNSPLKNKQELIKEAELRALKSAKQVVEKWTKAKSSGGKLMSANMIINRLTSGNLATEKFHEWDRFLNDEGEINYKSWPLGATPSLPEDKRSSVDLVSFISKNYPENPAKRKEEAKKREEQSKKRSDIESTFFRATIPGNKGSHSSSTVLRSCGTPGAAAAAQRPEFNGRQ